MEQKKKLNWEWVPGLGWCWRFRFTTFSALVPSNSIKRLIEIRDLNDSPSMTRIIFSDDKSIQIPMNLDDLIKELNEEVNKNE